MYRIGKADCSRDGPELGADDLSVAWCCPVDGRGIDRRYTACRLYSNTARPLSFASFLTQALPIGGVADTAQNIVDRRLIGRVGQFRRYGSQDKRTGASEELSA